MAGTPAKFAQLLTAAVRRIQSLESTKIAIIQDELGYAVGRTGSTIEHWRKGNLPAKASQIEALARVLAARSDFDQKWFKTFLSAAGYPHAGPLSEELRPPQSTGQDAIGQDATSQDAISHAAPAAPVDTTPRTAGALHIPPQAPPTLPRAENFVGRQKELISFQHTLLTNHLALMIGMAGSGKTTLASELIRHMQWPDNRVFWHTMRAGEEFEDIVWRLANFLAWYGQAHFLRVLQSPTVPPYSILFDSLLYAISGKGYLLCFDDFHLANESTVPDQLRKSLAGYLEKGEVAVLMISRHDVTPIMPVDDVTVSNPSNAYVSGLSLDETRLLLAHQGLGIADEKLTSLYGLTQGNPELLMLVSGALKHTMQSQNQTLEMLEVPSVERYILHEIDDKLTAAERAVMGAISALLNQPATRAVVEAITDTGNVWTTLNNLTRRFLLTANRRGREREYSQHALVQAFYYDSLTQAERRTFHLRAGEYFAEMQELVNAATHYEHANQLIRAAQLVTNHTRTFIQQGRAHFATRLLERCMASQAWSEEAVATRTAICQTRGILHRMQGQYPQALDMFQIGTQLASAPESKMDFLYEMGYVYEAQGDFQHALACYTQSLDVSAAGETSTAVEAMRLARPHLGLGSSYYRLGQLAESRTHFQTSLRTLEGPLEGMKNRYMVAQNEQGLGLIEWREGRLTEALARFEKCRTIFHELGDLIGEAQAINNMGAVHDELGDQEQTLTHWEQMIETFEDLGDVTGLLFGYYNLGFLYLRQQKVGMADDFFQRVSELAAKVNQQRMRSRAIAGLAETALAKGRTADALELAQHARELAVENQCDAERAISDRVLGLIHLDLNDPTQAAACLEQSIPLLEATQENEQLKLAQQAYARTQS